MNPEHASEFTVHGSCKLRAPDCAEAKRADCRAEIRERASNTLRALQQAVVRYLDNPGCNLPSKRTAMERLRWALTNSYEATRE